MRKARNARTPEDIETIWNNCVLPCLSKACEAQSFKDTFQFHNGGWWSFVGQDSRSSSTSSTKDNIWEAGKGSGHILLNWKGNHDRFMVMVIMAVAILLESVWIVKLILYSGLRRWEQFFFPYGWEWRQLHSSCQKSPCWDTGWDPVRHQEKIENANWIPYDSVRFRQNRSTVHFRWLMLATRFEQQRVWVWTCMSLQNAADCNGKGCPNHSSQCLKSMAGADVFHDSEIWSKMLR